jgi:Pyruvate/2-oxoacid:ferredoxin oxidoreductase gamma subunit
VVSRPKVAAAFNKPSFERCDPMVAPDGLLAYNCSLIDFESRRRDITVLPVPATKLADELGNSRLTNVIMLGAILTARPVLPLEAVARALEEHIPAHRREMLALNYDALELGATFAIEKQKQVSCS